MPLALTCIVTFNEREQGHLYVSMAMVTVQSAAEPSRFARKAVREMRHVRACHGSTALRTADFLTSASIGCTVT